MLSDPKYNNFFNKLGKLDPGSKDAQDLRSVLSKEQEVQLSFMEAAIGRINNCLCRIYTIENILVEKGLISKDDLIKRVEEARHLPQTNLGRSILKEMIKGEPSMKTDPVTIQKSDNSDAISRIEQMVNLSA